jgi:hypothetical protein
VRLRVRLLVSLALAHETTAGLATGIGMLGAALGLILTGIYSVVFRSAGGDRTGRRGGGQRASVRHGRRGCRRAAARVEAAARKDRGGGAVALSAPQCAGTAR